MYVSGTALRERAAELERFAREKGLDLSEMPRREKPVARIGRLATKLGIDLKLAFDMERPFPDPGSGSTA
jgi:hypothetical protein